MYCKNCGSQISDNAVMCPNCGVPTDNMYTTGYVQKSETNVLALVGFILSFFVTIAGLVCSIIGYKRAGEFNGNGKGLALAGIIISSIELGVGVLLLLLSVVVYCSILNGIQMFII